MLPPGFQPRMDAAESLFVERALLQVEEETYNTLIPPMEGRRYVPTDNKDNPGAKFTSYRRYTRNGIARLITERGHDLPNASIFVAEDQHQYYAVGASYQYDYLEALAAAFAMKNGGPPVNLDTELGIAAYEAVEKKLDVISAVGSAASSFGLENEVDVGMTGLLNQASTNIYVLANGINSGTTAWSGKTPDEIIADLVGIVAAQVANTFKVHVPSDLVGPVNQYETISGRSMGDGRSDTVLSYYMKTTKHIQSFDSWIYCSGAGAGSTDRLVCYRKEPRFVRHKINMEFTQLPPQLKDMTWKILCLAQTAGVVCPYPLSISYGDGL